jgi:hypothetical protein
VREHAVEMKKIREDEPVGVIIHTYMEISQGNLLCSYLYSNKLKCHVFLFYLFLFFFYKIREQEGGASPAQGGGSGNSEGRGIGERGRRVNMVQKMCTRVYKCKNDTC